MGRISLRK